MKGAIALLVNNHFRDASWIDPRIYKEALTLRDAGYEVVILAGGKFGRDYPRTETWEGLQIVRCPTLLQRLYAWGCRIAGQRNEPAKDRQAYYRRGADNLRERCISRLLQFMTDLNRLLFCGAVLPEAIRRRADIYVGNDLDGLLPACLAARFTGARLVYDSHELWTEMARAMPYSRLHRAVVSRLEGAMARRCDLVITVTESVGRILAERYGLAAPVAIPNVHPYVAVAPSAEIRARLTGGVDKRVAIFVGKLDPSRGVEELVESAAYLDDDTCIALVGDGPLRPMLEQRVNDRHLAGRVRFVGWIPFADILAYVASADVGISPASAGPQSCLNNYYSLDNKSFHYILAGIPLIANYQPEKRRLVEQYGIGAIYDESQPQDLARAIRRVLADPVEFEAMRARCRKAAREELNWEVVAVRYLAAFERLLPEMRSARLSGRLAQ